MTSGNGSSGGGGESDPEKAPPLSQSHILTHLIEGFVIQEGNTPFPLERPSFSVDCLRRHRGDMKTDCLRRHRGDMKTDCLRRHRGDMKTDSLSLKELRLQEPMLTCELCGKVDFSSTFKRSRRFCSTVCAKRYTIGCSKRVALFTTKASIENMKKQRALHGPLKDCPQESRRKKPAPESCHSPQPAQGESSQCADLPYPGASSPRTSPSSAFLPADPGQWNVDHVYDFICSLPGCLDVAEHFRSQEIDGQALLLLKEDHLMGAMNIKLGPALKIFAQISMLKNS